MANSNKHLTQDAQQRRFFFHFSHAESPSTEMKRVAEPAARGNLNGAKRKAARESTRAALMISIFN
jgi:hypothetical protein